MPIERAEGRAYLTPEGAMRLCEDMPIGCALVDKDGGFQWTNRFMWACMDYTEGQLRSLTIDEITHDKYFKVDEDLKRQLINGELTRYTVVKAYHKAGSRPERPRYVWGTLTVQRHPVRGEFQYYWIWFVPHNDMKETGAASWKDILIFVRDNYKWIVTVIGIAIALASGNLSAVSALLNKQNAIEKELHSGPPSSSSDSDSSPR